MLRMSIPYSDAAALVESCLKGQRRAASQLITLFESPDPKIVQMASDAVSKLPFPSQTIGLTGPPGAGKSTLLDYAVSLYRARGVKVGVLAIDPSSPFTGGALLGDRIRMDSLRNDTGVFIRSMGSRGATGALAAAACDALRVLSAAGYSTVFLETVGAGQAETEIANLADTICVVQVPGLGDDIQLMKMGILEIADVFVVNKSDKPGAQELATQIEWAIQDQPRESCRVFRQLGSTFDGKLNGLGWTPAVVLVSALQRKNGEALVEACDRHLAFLRQPALEIPLKRNRITREVVCRACRRFQELLDDQLAVNGSLMALIDACVEGTLSPNEVVSQYMKK